MISNEYIFIDGYSMSNRDDVMFGYLDDDLGIVKLPDRDGVDYFGLLKKSFEDGAWIGIDTDKGHEAVEKDNFTSYGKLEAIVKLDKKGFIDDVGNKIDRIKSENPIENNLIPYGCVIKLSEEGKKLKDYYKKNNITPRFSTYYDVERDDSICDKRDDRRTTIITKIKPITLSILDDREPAKDVPNNRAVINSKTIQNEEQEKNLTSINDISTKEKFEDMPDEKEISSIKKEPVKSNGENEKSCNEDKEQAESNNSVVKNEDTEQKEKVEKINLMEEKLNKLVSALQEQSVLLNEINKKLLDFVESKKKSEEKVANEEETDKSTNSIVDEDSGKKDCDKDPKGCEEDKGGKSTNCASVNSVSKDFIDDIINSL